MLANSVIDFIPIVCYGVCKRSLFDQKYSKSSNIFEILLEFRRLCCVAVLNLNFDNEHYS